MRTLSFKSPATVAMVASMLIGLAGCEAVQPTPTCRVRPSQYAARYAVEGSPQGMCTDKVLTGEIIHLNFFRNKSDYAEGAPSVGIEAASVADAWAAAKDMMPAPTGVEYSQGDFTTPRPGSDDMCHAPTLSEAKITTPMASLSYKWSNFAVIVSPLSAAIYFGADLERKDGDCTVKYKVSAIYPAHHCGDGKTPRLDDKGMPVLDEKTKEPLFDDDPTTGKPVQDKCNPVQGSGLYPDIEYICDATPDGLKGSHLCLPKQDFPRLK